MELTENLHTQADFLIPSGERVSFDGMLDDVFAFIGYDTSQKYNLIIGTDSFLSKDTLFVSAVIIHRVGHGGRYYYRKIKKRKLDSMRHRIFLEATMSIELASEIMGKLNENGHAKLPVEIHLDVGNNGETREIIKEVVGMVTGSGYAAVTKPASYGASKVADRHSK